LKVLIQIPQLIYAGAEKVLVDFANYLNECGHTVEILETYEKGYLKPLFNKGILFNAICSNRYTQKYYASLSQIKKEKNIFKKISLVFKKIFSMVVGYQRFAEHLAKKNYRNKKYDVAVNYLEIESPSFLLNNIKAGKYIQWIHTDVSKARIEHSFLNDYNKFDKFVCVSEYAKEQFVRVYPQFINHTVCIYNFYNKNDILKKSTQEKIELSNDFNIVSVGRFTPPKSYLRAVDVLHKLKSEGYTFHWFIIGTGVQYEEVCEKIKKLGMEDVITLLGIKDNPYPYIKSCDLFFLPSEWEGFPTVTVEAKILNKPVLATDVCGIREQIIDQIDGVIVENSEDGIYKGLKCYMDNPKLLDDYSISNGIDKIIDNNIKYEEFISICKELKN